MGIGAGGVSLPVGGVSPWPDVDSVTILAEHRHGAQQSSHDVTATLLLSCDDVIGIIATVTGFVNDHGGIICSSETHQDEEQSKFFQRLEFPIDHFDLDRETIRPLLEWEIGDHFSVRSRIAFSDEEQRVGCAGLETGALPARSAVSLAARRVAGTPGLHHQQSSRTTRRRPSTTVSRTTTCRLRERRAASRKSR